MTDYQRIEKVIRYLQVHQREQPSLAQLSRVAGLSESHFHRMFSRWAGTTPKGFLKALSAESAKRLLRESRDLLSVSMETGLSGPGRLHDLIVTVEGVSPGELKSGGEGLDIWYGVQATPFGDCLIGVTRRGICHLSFLMKGEEIPEALELKWPGAHLIASQRETAAAAKKIFERGSGKLSVHIGGTPFQLQVWRALLQIPSGRLTTYSELAETIGRPGAARAVGTAVGSNTIGYLIPCHRVIRETGVIGEYAWGRERKQAMLDWETS